MREVAPPSTDVLVQFRNHPFETDTPLARCDFAHTLAEPFQALGVDTDSRVGLADREPESEVLRVARLGHAAFGFIDLQLQLAGNEAAHALHHSVPRSLASDIDDTVAIVVPAASVHNPEFSSPFLTIVTLVG